MAAFIERPVHSTGLLSIIGVVVGDDADPRIETGSPHGLGVYAPCKSVSNRDRLRSSSRRRAVRFTLERIHSSGPSYTWFRIL